MRKRRTYDHEILLLQGGGALGAYQCGVYEGLAEVGVLPNWFVGISIGAVNSAILAGNPPERRLERLRTFWDRASAFSGKFELPSYMEVLRPLISKLNFATVAASGIEGFFKPRSLLPALAAGGSLGALSYYDTAPLKSTLEELVDFDLINSGKVRISLGAVNVRTAESIYFDNRYMKIGPEHVMASGALPPGFPPVVIDGEYYFDGGVVSNSPLTYIWDEKPLITALILQVNLFNAHGAIPRDLDAAMERVKDIQFSSKQRFTTEKVREIQEMRAALGRVLGKLSSDLKGDPDVAKLATLCDYRDWTIAHINNRRPSHGGQWKDAEFSRDAVYDRWAGGLEDVRMSAANLEWMQPVEAGPGIRIYYLPPVSASMGPPASRTATALKVADVPRATEDKPRHDTHPRRTA